MAHDACSDGEVVRWKAFRLQAELEFTELMQATDAWREEAEGRLLTVHGVPATRPRAPGTAGAPHETPPEPPLITAGTIRLDEFRSRVREHGIKYAAPLSMEAVVAGRPAHDGDGSPLAHGSVTRKPAALMDADSGAGSPRRLPGFTTRAPGSYECRTVHQLRPASLFNTVIDKHIASAAGRVESSIAQIEEILTTLYNNVKRVSRQARHESHKNSARRAKERDQSSGTAAEAGNAASVVDVRVQLKDVDSSPAARLAYRVQEILPSIATSNVKIKEILKDLVVCLPGGLEGQASTAFTPADGLAYPHEAEGEREARDKLRYLEHAVVEYEHALQRMQAAHELEVAQGRRRLANNREKKAELLREICRLKFLLSGSPPDHLQAEIALLTTALDEQELEAFCAEKALLEAASLMNTRWNDTAAEMATRSAVAVDTVANALTAHCTKLCDRWRSGMQLTLERLCDAHEEATAAHEAAAARMQEEHAAEVAELQEQLAALGQDIQSIKAIRSQKARAPTSPVSTPSQAFSRPLIDDFKHLKAQLVGTASSLSDAMSVVRVVEHASRSASPLTSLLNSSDAENFLLSPELRAQSMVRHNLPGGTVDPLGWGGDAGADTRGGAVPQAPVSPGTRPQQRVPPVDVAMGGALNMLLNPDLATQLHTDDIALGGEGNVLQSAAFLYLTPSSVPVEAVPAGVGAEATAAGVRMNPAVWQSLPAAAQSPPPAASTSDGVGGASGASPSGGSDVDATGGDSPRVAVARTPFSVRVTSRRMRSADTSHATAMSVSPPRGGAGVDVSDVDFTFDDDDHAHATSPARGATATADASPTRKRVRVLAAGDTPPDEDLPPHHPSHPSHGADGSAAEVARLRKENAHLRALLAQARQGMALLAADHAALQGKLEGYLAERARAGDGDSNVASGDALSPTAVWDRLHRQVAEVCGAAGAGGEGASASASAVGDEVAQRLLGAVHDHLAVASVRMRRFLAHGDLDDFLHEYVAQEERRRLYRLNLRELAVNAQKDIVKLTRVMHLVYEHLRRRTPHDIDFAISVLRKALVGRPCPPVTEGTPKQPTERCSVDQLASADPSALDDPCAPLDKRVPKDTPPRKRRKELRRALAVAHVTMRKQREPTAYEKRLHKYSKVKYEV